MPDDLPRIPKKRGPRNKPRNDAWLQQQLAAYRPLYTFRCALPIVSILSFMCIAISIAFYKSSMTAHEVTVDYTSCDRTNDSHSWHFYDDTNLYCKIRVALPDIPGDVRFFYGLHGFFQNVRKYQQSRNDRQLAGELHETERCYPFTHDESGLPIVPCGAVANSMFNDTFRLFYNGADGAREMEVPWSTDKLLHTAFRAEKYKNPQKCTDQDDVCGPGVNCTKRCPGFERTAKPPWWSKSIAELGDVETGWALENFDFIQWMETAALPDFRKVYRHLDQKAGSAFANGLPAGKYTLLITYNYPVHDYGARKLFVIQQDGLLGPKAHFQMCAYFTVGLFLLLFSVFMAVVEFAPGCTLRVRRVVAYFQPPEISGL
ncbi:hypothetical protein M3Y99_01253300 [Aphelenchoides fujianensis]|nr:hypothetical protein M3Y99_01253300 [Aphelenchoides fujianensis]